MFVLFMCFLFVLCKLNKRRSCLGEGENCLSIFFNDTLGEDIVTVIRRSWIRIPGWYNIFIEFQKPFKNNFHRCHSPFSSNGYLVRHLIVSYLGIITENTSSN